MAEREPRGYLAFVLHAHLPFIRHPEHRAYLEERWLYEAILESYLPLATLLRRLRGEGVPAALTLSLSPTLVAMLRDPLLQGRFVEYLEGVTALARSEAVRAERSEERDLAAWYAERFAAARGAWDGLGGDVPGAFAALEAEGALELMTTAATHGLLPLLASQPEAVRAQVAVAVQHHREQFGRSPRGIWLPECAYEPGLDEVLADYGLRFFVADTHALEHASSVPRWGVYAPVYCPNGVAVFGRDPESSRQVWSMDTGYPGDPVYRDFYRDAGWDLPRERLGAAGHPDGLRGPVGLKYHRVTAAGETKDYYRPEEAATRAAEHAAHFLAARARQAAWLAPAMDRPPVTVAPYDAELFGHWWHEGPAFLEAVFRGMQAATPGLEPVTLPEVLRRHPVNQMVLPSSSSWGAGGYNFVWLSGSNAWLYRHLHLAASDMVRLARRHRDPDEPTRRALNQAARELLLAQASDWAFILMTRTSEQFAADRVKAHLARFQRLGREIDAGAVDPGWLADLEARDNLFPRIDYRIYR